MEILIWILREVSFIEQNKFIVIDNTIVIAFQEKIPSIFKGCHCCYKAKNIDVAVLHKNTQSEVFWFWRQRRDSFQSYSYSAVPVVAPRPGILRSPLFPGAHCPNLCLQNSLCLSECKRIRHHQSCHLLTCHGVLYHNPGLLPPDQKYLHLAWSHLWLDSQCFHHLEKREVHQCFKRLVIFKLAILNPRHFGIRVDLIQALEVAVRLGVATVVK